MTGETKAFTSQSKLCKGHDGIRNYDAYRVDFSARILDTVFFLKDFFDISLPYFIQFDTTSKDMYGHEIICTGKHGLGKLKIIRVADNDVTMQWLPLSGKFVHKENGGFVNKANDHRHTRYTYLDLSVEA